MGQMTPKISTHVYEVRPRKDKRGVDLISDALPFGRLWYGEPNNCPRTPLGRTTHSRGLIQVRLKIK
jgi:hypothetical protein